MKHILMHLMITSDLTMVGSRLLMVYWLLMWMIVCRCRVNYSCVTLIFLPNEGGLCFRFWFKIYWLIVLSLCCLVFIHTSIKDNHWDFCLNEYAVVLSELNDTFIHDIHCVTKHPFLSERVRENNKFYFANNPSCVSTGIQIFLV